MIISLLPPFYASMQGELPYRFTANSEPETVLSVLKDDTVIASKRYYDTYAAQIDVAPIIRKHLRFAPPQSTEMLYEQTDRRLAITVAVDGTTSETRCFISTSRPRNFTGFLTSMPWKRIIRRGDVDELTLLSIGTLQFSIHGSQLGNVLYSETRTETNKKQLHFRFNPEQFPDYTRFYVQLYEDEELIDQIEYVVAEPLPNGCRLAWRTDAGSVEHYTFPISRDNVLISAFEPKGMIEALRELTDAPQVWRTSDGVTYEEVEVVRDKSKVVRHGSLSCMEVAFRPKNTLR